METQINHALLLTISILCTASGSRGRFEDSPPRIVEDPSDLIVSKGEPATLNCKAEGRPHPTVEWYKDGERVETDRDDARSHRMLLPSGSLFFLRIVHGRRSKPDEGVYTCVARNYLGEALSRNASLEVAILRDDFRQAPSDVVVAAGEPAVMDCVPPRGHPEPTVSWKRNNVRVSNKDDRISMRGGKLMITNTRKSDAGMYVCVGVNMVGERDSDPAELVVYERPVLIRRPVNQVVIEEETVDFLCEVHGDPAPTVRWRREEGELPRGRFEIHSDNSLRLMRVREEDEGTYTCMSENSVGKTEASAMLQVHGPSDRVPPIIRQGPANHTSALGSVAQLQCRAIGGPTLSITWEKDGKTILGDDPRVTLMQNGTLQIADVKDTDSGIYMCVASSTTGESSWTGTLSVRGDGATDTSVPRESESIQLPGPPQKPVVTEVTRNTVTLTWQSNPHEGGAAVTSYIIEAFSQSVGSAWQTVADHVKQERHTVIGLYPNTVYLFIVRAVNSYGLSDPSPISEPVRTHDGSPNEQGLDHRQVQRDLREVSVYLQKPIVLSSTSALISWAVVRPSQYVQGYRLQYRPTGSTWLAKDVKVGPKLSTVLSDLRRNTEYEVKIRPYFNELQGLESPVLLLHTPDQVLSAPPQAVSVVQLTNSSSISVSWEPPPADGQSGTVLEYKVWCLGKDSEKKTVRHINRTVDGTVLSVLLTGLLPDLHYSVLVAAVTSLGVGEHSPPIDLLLTLRLDVPSDPLQKHSNLSLSEQITGVVSQPAFIVGLGVASWLVLMGFSGWLYCRHRRRKELGHYTTSFAYTPAVGFAHSEGSGLINGSRPGILGSTMGNYPWLADSWPAPGLAHGKDSVNCCSGKLDSTDRYYNEVAISNYLSQCEKHSSASNNSPIYSTINTAASDNLQSLAYYDTYSSMPYTQGPDPYSTPILSNSDLFGLGQDMEQWTMQSGQSGEYAKLQYAWTNNAKLVKQRSTSSASKPAPLNWENVLSLPLPANEEQGYHKPERNEGSDSSSDQEDWCPPLPARTYLMEDLPREEEGVQGTSYSLQSTSKLPPSPREETPPTPQDSPRLKQFDLLVHYGPSSQVSQSNPNLLANKDAHDVSQWGDTLKVDSFTAERNGETGRSPPWPAESIPTTQGHRPRIKQKGPRDGQHKRDAHDRADLPPPPAPPPATDDPMQLLADVMDCSHSPLSGSSPARQKRADSSSPQKKWPAAWGSQDEGVIPYCPSSFLPQGQMSGYGGLGGGASFRDSPGQRGPGAARRKDENLI
ncbi:hypothetical protein UPYG_G00201040 [Umbra pygmaea]|uniref:Roundabout homolog 2-like n=1 Tax=Umbra pygmaea TaxID=75934 RepID=A0ABD0X4C6_UMBPY